MVSIDKSPFPIILVAVPVFIVVGPLVGNTSLAPGIVVPSLVVLGDTDILYATVAESHSHENDTDA